MENSRGDAINRRLCKSLRGIARDCKGLLAGASGGAPFRGVVDDVGRNALVGGIVSYNDIVEAGVPAKINALFSDFVAAAAFVPADDAGQVFVKHGVVGAGDAAGRR